MHKSIYIIGIKAFWCTLLDTLEYTTITMTAGCFTLWPRPKRGGEGTSGSKEGSGRSASATTEEDGPSAGRVEGAEVSAGSGEDIRPEGEDGLGDGEGDAEGNMRAGDTEGSSGSGEEGGSDMGEPDGLELE